MRATILRVATLTLAWASTSSAQANPIHLPIAYLADAYPGTPTEQGLLATAATEAAIAAQHAELAVVAMSSFEDVRLHAGHVLHALDPELVAGGPGLGYGVRQAAAAAATYIGMVTADSTASENVKLHAAHIAASIVNVVERADAMVLLAQQIETATSAAAATTLIAQLNALGAALVQGRDANGDGLIGWQVGEGGLRQAVQHMTLLKRGDGLRGAER
jgi:hypothetical protein